MANEIGRERKKSEKEICAQLLIVNCPVFLIYFLLVKVDNVMRII